MAGAGHGDGSRLNLRFAWPSGSWGSLPIEGGVEAAYRREIEAAEDPRRFARRSRRGSRLRSPFLTAERSASRRSSTRATPGRSSATGLSAHTRVRRAGGRGGGAEPTRHGRGGRVRRAQATARRVARRRKAWSARRATCGPYSARHARPRPARRGRGHDPLDAQRRPAPTPESLRRRWTAGRSTAGTSGATTCCGGSTA